MSKLKVKIADFIIDYDNYYSNILSVCEGFRTKDFSADLIVKRYKAYNLSDSENLGKLLNAEEAYFHTIIGEFLPKNNAVVLHSATFDINGAGVAFSALSGTGKSTHLANWYAYINGTADMPESLKRLLKDENLNIEKDGSLPKLTVVNGDKPIVRFFDEDFCKENDLEIPTGTEFGVPYAYGTPWCGKEHLGCNMRTPLKHICFIERSDTNFVTKIDKAQAVERIMQQVYMPKDPVALSKTLELVNRLINSCELWIIHCNMEPESAEVAYKAIFG